MGAYIAAGVLLLICIVVVARLMGRNYPECAKCGAEVTRGRTVTYIDGERELHYCERCVRELGVELWEREQ